MLNLPLRVLILLGLLTAVALAPFDPKPQTKEGGCLDPLGRPVPCQPGP